MATRVRVSTKGLEQHLAKLAEQKVDIDKVVLDALAESAAILQAEMVRLAPVKTGNLREHIKIFGPERDGNFTYVEVGVIHSRKFTDAKTARYANAQEYGTSSMAAHPFIRTGTTRAKGKARRLLIMRLRKAAE